MVMAWYRKKKAAAEAAAMPAMIRSGQICSSKHISCAGFGLPFSWPPMLNRLSLEAALRLDVCLRGVGLVGLVVGEKGARKEVVVTGFVVVVVVIFFHSL